MRISDWSSDVCSSDLQGVVALRQRDDEVVGADRLRRRLDLGAGGAGIGVADVLLDGRGEQERLLQDHGDVAAERSLRHPPHVAAADQHPALPDIVEAMHQRRRAGLRSEEHTSELQSLMRISYAVFCLQKKNK